MESATQSDQSQPWIETLKNQGKKRGMLELWTGVLGNQMVESHAREHARNREAQGRQYRDQIAQGDADESEDMGQQTILGDVTNPTPIVIAGQQSGGSDLIKGLAIAALSAAIPSAGIAGYLLSNAITKPTPVVTPINQTDFSIGLGKIEDYLTKGQK